MSKRVLICDDSLLMRKMVSDTLTDAGWEVVGEAVNGNDAVEKFAQLRPDAVTMDIVMPEADGLEALPKILQLDPRAKVVVVSALAQTSKISDAIRLGAQDFIVKPFMPEQLQHTMERCAEAATGV
ncbi:MAG: response regulator [Pirellulaceae bacterium]